MGCGPESSITAGKTTQSAPVPGWGVGPFGCQGWLGLACAPFASKFTPSWRDDCLDQILAIQSLSAQVALTAKVFLLHCICTGPRADYSWGVWGRVGRKGGGHLNTTSPRSGSSGSPGLWTVLPPQRMGRPSFHSILDLPLKYLLSEWVPGSIDRKKCPELFYNKACTSSLQRAGKKVTGDKF